jgi:hypothetical protein
MKMMMMMMEITMLLLMMMLLMVMMEAWLNTSSATQARALPRYSISPHPLPKTCLCPVLPPPFAPAGCLRTTARSSSSRRSIRRSPTSRA